MADTTYHLKIKVDADIAEAKKKLAEAANAGAAIGRKTRPSPAAVGATPGRSPVAPASPSAPRPAPSPAAPTPGRSPAAAMGGMSSIGRSASSQILSAVGTVGSALASIPGMVLDFAKGITFAVGAAAAAFAGAVYAAHKIMGAAAEDQRYKLQLSRLGAAGNLPYYNDVAAKGPQSLGEVVRAGIQLESYGLDSREWATVLQDSAAMFGTSMEELGGAIGRLKSGQAGEALEALRRIGVTRDQLEARGVKFDASGQLKSSIIDALAAVKASMVKTSGGMAGTMSLGYEGAVSNLGDAVHLALSKAFEGALPYASAVIRTVESGVKAVGEALGTVNWEAAGESLVNVAASARDLITGIDWAGWSQTMLGWFDGASNMVKGMLDDAKITGIGAMLSKAVADGLAFILDPMLWVRLIGGAIQDAGIAFARLIYSALLGAGAVFVTGIESTVQALENLVGEGTADNRTYTEKVRDNFNSMNNAMGAASPYAWKTNVEKGVADAGHIAISAAGAKPDAKAAPENMASAIAAAASKSAAADAQAMVKSAMDIGRSASTIKIDPNAPGASQAALDAAKNEMDIARDMATIAIDELKARHAAELESMDKGSTPGKLATYEGRVLNQKLELANLEQGLGKAGEMVSGKESERNKAIDALRKQNESSASALNKMVSQLLNEIRSMNDYSMSEFNESVFA